MTVPVTTYRSDQILSLAVCHVTAMQSDWLGWVSTSYYLPGIWMELQMHVGRRMFPARTHLTV